MKNLILLVILSVSALSFSQTNKDDLISSFGINKDSIDEVIFKDKDSFNRFVNVFEDKKGFRPQWFIIDSTGKLLKHKLDIQIKECGKGDVGNIKKKYHKDLPNISELSTFFKEDIKKPIENEYVIIFMWMKGLGIYNEHTFDTYNIWKDNNNIKFYFLDLGTVE